MLTDRLYARVKTGDAKAFEELFRQLYPSMCVIANKYIQDTDIAEDIAQEAFIKLWNIRDQYEDISSLKSFLYILVKNLSINYLKREKLNAKYLDSLNKDDFLHFNNAVIEEETYRILHQAIASLPTQSSRIMQLSINGVQNQEISERLGISINTVKTLKYKALKTLKITLKDYFFILILILG